MQATAARVVEVERRAAVIEVSEKSLQERERRVDRLEQDVKLRSDALSRRESQVSERELVGIDNASVLFDCLLFTLSLSCIASVSSSRWRVGAQSQRAACVSCSWLLVRGRWRLRPAQRRFV